MSAFRFGGAATRVSAAAIEFNTCADTGVAWAAFGPYGKSRRAASRVLSLSLPESTDGFSVKGNMFYRTTGIAVEILGKGRFVLDGNSYWLPEERFPLLLTAYKFILSSWPLHPLLHQLRQ